MPTDMGILTGSGRVGRLNYFGIGLSIALALAFAFYAGVTVDEFTGETQISPLVIPIALGGMWFSTTNVIRRLHDCGRSGWLMLLSAVPIIGPLLNLYLLFAPGDRVRNLYGPPPGAQPPTAEEHRQRMDAIAAAAGEVYRARAGSEYLNGDGTFNIGGLEMAGETDSNPRSEATVSALVPAAATTAAAAPPVPSTDGAVATAAHDIHEVELPPLPLAPPPDPGGRDFSPPMPPLPSGEPDRPVPPAPSSNTRPAADAGWHYPG